MIRNAAGETLDLKPYEADMRHLIDTYIEAKEPRKISPFYDMSLLDIIATLGIEDGLDTLPDSIKRKKDAVAETIENNVRAKIIKERLQDPAFYDKMSKLLDEIIAARKANALAYEAYLDQIAKLVETVRAGQEGDRPAAIKTDGQRALHNNLSKDADLATRIDAKIKQVRPADWRGVQAREQQIKAAIYGFVKDADETERLFAINLPSKGILMETVLDLGGVSVDVIRKDIKNLHLRVHPPTGRVRIAAPERTSLDTIRAFAISHLVWIRRNQRKINMQVREPPREYVDRESHFVWGERVMLQIERDAAPGVVLRHRTLVLQVRPEATTADREGVMEGWYRDEVRRAAAPILAKWQKHLGVEARRTFVQRMKTKWGSCNPLTENIHLNTDLAKKPPECLEYVVLHELAHLRVRTHSAEFFALLDIGMPQWREVRRTLNDLPLRSEPISAG